MFCKSEPESFMAEQQQLLSQLMNLSGANGGAQLPVSIAAAYHVYANGNAANCSPPVTMLENTPNPQNPHTNPQNPHTAALNPQNLTTTPANPQSFSPNPQSPGAIGEANPRGEVRVPRYRECQRNYAASLGGHTVDGCGEFMPADEDGLKCAACGCHRNFHRREVEGEETPPPCECCARRDRKRGAGEPPVVAYYTPPLPHGSSAAAAFHIPMGISESDDLDANNVNNNNYEHSQGRGLKKRFRTKFSQDQKDKMCYFAEKIGWKMKKEDEASVQEFCNQIGVGKGVLKVWMHNNKHTLGKKPS